jgi:hypothetical protein
MKELHDHGDCANCGRRMFSEWENNWAVTQRPSWVSDNGTYILVCPACFDVKYRQNYKHLGRRSMKPAL